MQPLHLKKVVLISAAAGVSLLVIAGISLGLLKLQNDPRTMSLALRVDAEQTQYFLRSSDRDVFVKTVASVVPDISGQLPEGDRYEFAVVQSGSGTSWIIYVHTTAEGKHVTLVSKDDASLFLPAGKSKTSLGRTSLLRTYVGSQDRDYLWVRPAFLPQGTSVAGIVTRAMLKKANAVLLLQEKAYEEGLLIIESESGTSYTPVNPAPAREPMAHATLEIGSPKNLLRAMASSLEEEEPSLKNGLRGIAMRILKGHTDSTDLESLTTDLLHGPLTVELFRGKNDGVSVVISGMARSEDVILTWLKRMAETRSSGAQRTISFYEGENVRIDVHAGSGHTLETLNEKDGWTLMRVGESGSTALFAALSGKNYVVSLDAALLPSYASTTEEKQHDDSALRGSMDVPWLLSSLEKTAPELAAGMREDIGGFLGAHATRVRFSAKPVAHGWMIAWSVGR